MKMTKLYITLLLVSAALFMYSCESVTNSVPQDEEILTQEMTLDGSAQTKVDVCHYDAETDAYQLITIADPAVDAHINHGDAQPGDAVPTMEGFEFDETCTPKSVVVVVEMTACFADALNLLLPLIPEVELTFEDYNWSIDKETETGFQILATLENGSEIRLSAFIGSSCSMSYILNDGRGFGSSGSVGNFEDDKAYLEYLLTL